MKKLICDKKGETLVEVLAAILIFTLSSIILYSMVTTASKVNMKAKEKDAEVQDQMKIAEYASAANSTAGTVTMTLHKNDGSKIKDMKTFNVFIFKDDVEGSLYAYHAQ